MSPDSEQGDPPVAPSCFPGGFPPSAPTQGPSITQTWICVLNRTD